MKYSKTIKASQVFKTEFPYWICTVTTSSVAEPVSNKILILDTLYPKKYPWDKTYVIPTDVFLKQDKHEEEQSSCATHKRLNTT